MRTSPEPKSGYQMIAEAKVAIPAVESWQNIHPRVVRSIVFQGLWSWYHRSSISAEALPSAIDRFEPITYGAVVAVPHGDAIAISGIFLMIDGTDVRAYSGSILVLVGWTWLHLIFILSLRARFSNIEISRSKQSLRH